MKSHVNCDKVQDPYSLRCIPQVHGIVARRHQTRAQVLEIEVNSVTDNPLVFVKGKTGKIVNGGNFHGEYVAIAMDELCIAVAELANISERRLEKLINPALSDLPAFLVKEGGLNSGFMIVQVAAASLVSENKSALPSGQRRFDSHLGRQRRPRQHGHDSRAQSHAPWSKTPGT